MAKAKYTRQKNGYFQARVWDGTYQGTQKHYIIDPIKEEQQRSGRKGCSVQQQNQKYGGSPR